MPGTDDKRFRGPFEQFLIGFANVGISNETVMGALEQVRVESGYSSVDSLFASGETAIGELWTQAYELLPPFSALFAGASMPVGAYPIVDYLAASCSTMQEGMEKLVRYFRLVRPGVTVALAQKNGVAEVLFHDQLRFDPFFDEWMVGITIKRFRLSTGTAFPLAGARFRTRKRPGIELDRLTAFLGCEPELEVTPGGFSVALEHWQKPMILRDDRMRESLEAHAERLLREDRSQNSEAHRVREVLLRELPGGDPSMVAIAKKLAMTPRTLQRRLSDEGASFQGVVDGVRAELADRYLEQDRLSVSEVAFLLGYSEASSFARAYRRWKGSSPVEARRAKPSSSR